MSSNAVLPDGYPAFLSGLKVRIREARVRAALSVNRELILLYWEIGRDILQRQQEEGWGAKVIERLSTDLRKEFPDVKGFSPRNLKYMRSFAEAWPDPVFVQQVAAQIPWFHNCVILDKLSNREFREWYIHKTIENGWSRNVVHQIEQAYRARRAGGDELLFGAPRPAVGPRPGDAQRSYIFDFLGIGEDAAERELERALLDHIREFLLGRGRVCVRGQPVSARCRGQGLLHRPSLLPPETPVLRGDRPEDREFLPDTGKMNFYLSAVDDLLRHLDDNPSIGIVLCKSRNRIIAEYALRDMETDWGRGIRTDDQPPGGSAGQATDGG